MFLLMFILVVAGCRAPEGPLNARQDALQMNATLLQADPTGDYKDSEIVITIWNRGDADVLMTENHGDWKTVLIDEEGRMHLPHHGADSQKYTSGLEVNTMRELKTGESIHYRSTVGASFPLAMKSGEYRVVVMRKMLNHRLQAETNKRLLVD